jgi:peroxidase
MAVGGRGRRPLLLLLLLLAVALALAARARAQLSPGFYSASCPTVHGVVRQVMSQVVMNDTRAGAAVLRLFYHDCFVGVRTAPLAAVRTNTCCLCSAHC